MTSVFASTEEEIAYYKFSFPIMEKLEEFLVGKADLRGRKIAWHCHLTGLTAATVKVLLAAGVELVLSECSPATSDKTSIEYMRKIGAKVYQGESSTQETLKHRPEIISDTGFVLSSAYLQNSEQNFVQAACEITSSGIQKLRATKDIKIPVININDGELKNLIENFHGVGDGVTDALYRVTGRLWSGRSAAVIGYGRVGAGVAYHLRQTGAQVSIVETDPTRRLLAHYDGYGLCSKESAIASCELIVTATGAKNILDADALQNCRDGIILMNVGHWAQEIDLDGLKSLAKSVREAAAHLVEYQLEVDKGSAKKLFVIGGGGPANVVMLTGSPEPTLIHLTTEVLCMRYLLNAKSSGVRLANGENVIPAEIQRLASELALASLKLQ